MAKLRSGMHRIEVHVSPEDYAALEGIRLAVGGKMCDVLRAAIRIVDKELLTETIRQVA